VVGFSNTVKEFCVCPSVSFCAAGSAAAATAAASAPQPA